MPVDGFNESLPVSLGTKFGEEDKMTTDRPV